MNGDKLSNILVSLKYSTDYKKEMETNSFLWQHICKQYIGKEYNKDNQNKDIETVKDFLSKPYDVYNNNFWKLRNGDSVCAVASPLTDKLKWFKRYYL